MGSHDNLKPYRTLVQTICALTLIGGILTGCGPDTKASQASGQKISVSQPAVAPILGDIAPQFSLPAFSGGKTVSLSDLLGQKPVLINVFASWCYPCQQEAHILEQGYNSLANHVTFIGINATSQESSAQAPLAFIQKYRISFPVLQDAKGIFLDHYAVIAFPTTYLVSPDGKIVNVKVGAFQSLSDLTHFVQSTK